MNISCEILRRECLASQASAAILLGDFNFHDNSEDDAIPGDFVDVWPVVCPGSNGESTGRFVRFPLPHSDVECRARTPGFTRDGSINTLSGSHDRCRLDRFTLASRHTLAERHDAADSNTVSVVPLPASSSTEDWRPQRSHMIGTAPIADGLWPSDHFGLVTVLELQVATDDAVVAPASAMSSLEAAANGQVLLTA